METVTCPAGHESTDLEYCEVCGLAMSGPVATPPKTVAPAAPAATSCPACGAALDGRFCEACGHDSLAVLPAAAAATAALVPAAEAGPASWTATVSADRAYYNVVMSAGGPDADGIAFPAFCPDRFFPLRGNQITIGRRSASRGINPDIDLTGPPEDPGVSHLHAMLIIQPGGLSIVDVGSSNGTTVNDDQTPLRPNVPRTLSTGDRIHLGAWTTITVQADR
jgi:FHA domain